MNQGGSSQMKFPDRPYHGTSSRILSSKYSGMNLSQNNELQQQQNMKIFLNLINDCL